MNKENAKDIIERLRHFNPECNQDLTDPSGWKVVNEFWYELKDPNGHYLNKFYDTTFKAMHAWQRIMKIKEEELKY